ncbi:RelA/SpoT domain-containing protein [Pedobacter gandavensis]|uniref:RelA/SpoT domain-containing protein n=1 Tax=Pedobacter gandavensis TaxID=2679963 RepID=A0ABR6EUH1_9SPHI|nr:hypothetical protein [Pedobacter gandavensis]MBB2148925.1 hypothetical protein [Pedobacter gandavensis]
MLLKIIFETLVKQLPLIMDEQVRNSILVKLGITKEKFNELSLGWEELEKIYNSHVKQTPELEKACVSIANSLMSNKNVHSVRYRVKDSIGLISKIIRKRIANPDRIINHDNYIDEVTDLMGVRAIHLMKSHWTEVDTNITDQWDLKETKTAYIRKGDSEEIQSEFSKRGFEVKEHPFGYRSLHYIIKTKPGKKELFVEIQVRTIFEEGWSEIDHNVRYPNETENEIFGEFLSIFNRIAGSADEMGSFIMNLKIDQYKNRIDSLRKLKLKDLKIKELEDKISSLKIDENVKIDIVQSLRGIDIMNSLTFKERPANYAGRLKNEFAEIAKSFNMASSKNYLPINIDEEKFPTGEDDRNF